MTIEQLTFYIKKEASENNYSGVSFVYSGNNDEIKEINIIEFTDTNGRQVTRNPRIFLHKASNYDYDNDQRYGR